MLEHGTRRVTTKDIARSLGLNPSTVSRALHNHPQIASATKEAVQAEARKLGYREDPSLKSLISYRWEPEKRAGLDHVALVMESAQADDLLPGEFDAIEESKRHALELGYEMEVFHLSDYRSPAALSKVLYHRGVTGVLIGRTTRRHDPQKFLFDWSKFAAIAIDAGATAFMCHNVLANHVCAVGRLWRTLQARGYRRVGAVLRNDQTRRLHSHETGAFYNGQSNVPEADRIPVCFARADKQPDDIVQWARRHRPDVIVSCQEETLEVLQSAGFKVPGDLHVAGLELLGRHPEMAGFEFVKSCYTEAVTQLDALLRLNRLGFPEHRSVLLIDPIWRPGKTLPGVETLSV
ncbi:MAG: LacI family DNA-binding transcriptional regulator [Verrucomicrobiota bacterium]